jgi:hypothetical protein
MYLLYLIYLYYFIFYINRFIYLYIKIFTFKFEEKRKKSIPSLFIWSKLLILFSLSLKLLLCSILFVLVLHVQCNSFYLCTTIKFCKIKFHSCVKKSKSSNKIYDYNFGTEIFVNKMKLITL